MSTWSKTGSARNGAVKSPSGPITREEIENRADEVAEAAKIVVLQEVQILRASTLELQANLRLVVVDLESFLVEREY